MTKSIFLIGLLCLTQACALFHLGDNSESSESWEEADRRHHHYHGNHDHGHKRHGICEGLEDVDLSDLSLDSADLRKFLNKQTGNEHETPEKSEDGEIVMSNIESTLTENAMGVVRKVIILPSKKRIYAKVLKIAKADGTFTTDISGSLNTTLETITTGKLNFDVDLSVYGASLPPHNTLKGEADAKVNSSVKFVKKGKFNVLETTVLAESTTSIGWNPDKPEAEGSLVANTSSAAASETAILNKQCFATKVGLGFKSIAAGKEWSTSIEGKGKGGVVSHVLYATANGTSVSWTFAKLSIKTTLEIDAGNSTVEGTQYITIKSFTETITRPINPSATNPSLNVDVSSEVKLRVGVKTLFKSGVKIYSTGGQVVFRNSKVVIPSQQVETQAEGVGDISGSEEEMEGAHIMSAPVLRKQIQAEEILSNPAFINSIIASSIN